MALKTKLCERLGLSAPVFLAPMAGVTTPELAIAVGKAGGLGSFGAAYTEPAALKEQVAKVRAAGNFPIHVNLFVEPQPSEPSADAVRAAGAALSPVFQALGLQPAQKLAPPYAPDLSAQVENALALKPAVLSSHFNAFDASVIKDAKKAGIVVGGSATTLEDALALEAAGYDFIIAQGAEAGGHRGTFSGAKVELIGVFALTRLIAKKAKVPVVAAGGIMDGAGIAAALALGAQAAQIGTAFIPCPESGAPAQHKRAVLELGGRGTAVTSAFSGRAARGIRNRFIEAAEAAKGPILEFPVQHRLTVPVRNESNKQGTPEYVALWAGQAVALAREAGAGELISSWMREAQDVLAGLRA